MRIAVVKPDPMSAKLLRFVLTEAGFQVTSLSRGQELLPILAMREADAVLLDVDLPDLDGCDLCRGLREQRYQGPVIFVSHRSETNHIVRAFDHGADDFIGEPFDPLELVARIEAVARRCRQADYQALGTVLKVGDVELSIADLTLRIGDQPPVLLTPTEMRMLECLMRNAEITISRETLIVRTWGYDFVGESNRVDVYVSRLRKKIERDPAEPEYLHTVRGIGYVFRARRPLVDVAALPGTRFNQAENGLCEPVVSGA